MIREVAALPTNIRLVSPLVLGATDLDFVDRMCAENLREGAEVLRRNASAGAANRARRAAAAVVISVELRGASDQAHLGRDLPVDALGGRMLFLRVRHVPIQEGVDAVRVERAWLVLELIGEKEVQAVTNDGAADGRAELLIRVRQATVENEVLGVELV